MPPRRPTLRLASFNVAGRLHSHVSAFAHALVDLDLDVVAVQEVKLSASNLPQCMHAVNHAVAARASSRGHRHSGFSFRASPNVAAPASAGVMLLWRRDLVASGKLVVHPETGGDLHWDGRAVAATFSWDGHTMQVASVYCPNDPAQRVGFLGSTVRQLWGKCPHHTLLLGDWNFTPDPGRDRRWRGPRPVGDVYGDGASAAALASAAPSAVDVFRFRHPTKYSYTFFHAGNGHAARHDRAYAGPGLSPYFVSCDAEPVCFSDHEPLVCALLSARPLVASGKGPRRARTDFLVDTSLHEEFRAWLRCQLQQAPPDSASLLVWWPVFKRRLLACTWAFYARWRASTSSPDFPDLVRQVKDAVQQLGRAATDREVAGAMSVVAASRAALRFNQQRVWQHSDRVLRQQWLHAGERPQPVITEQLKALQGGQSRAPVVLRAAGGALVWQGAGPANVAAAHYAAVSAQPHVEAAAQLEVLTAVRVAQPPDVAAADGSTVVQQGDVLAAMLSSRPGTAPGPDGLPLKLYKSYRAELLPMLARVFSAIGELHTVPRGFLDGCISAILKPGGDPLAAVGYRPITLLNTDYRLLARVLADRLQPALQTCVSHCQTAFLKGRRSGANILMLQLLWDGLPAASEVVAALLDFNKAYDTIDRAFLLDCLRELGVGDDFVRWMSLLLRGTAARVVMNGFLSSPRAFVAGVRQGCPLSPLLYLCVAEALVRWLQHKGVGVDVLGQRLCATQFADDTQVYLGSMRELPHFMSVMERFALASGQQLNTSKTKLLLVGRAARAQVEQLRVQLPPGSPQVATTATVLGVPIGERQPATGLRSAAFDRRVPGVLAALERLSCVRQLSAFGRGLGSAAYGVSQLLYAAEFDDVPSDSQCHQLTAAVAALVDRGVGPTHGSRGFVGVKAALLAGKPALGGFGALPWKEHILARHAWWAARFVSAPGDTPVPWIQLGRAMLRDICPAFGPLLFVDGVGGGHLSQDVLNRVPACLRRLSVGLAALGPVSGVLPEPGPWVVHAPIWGNPLVPCPAARLPPGDLPGGLCKLPRIQGAGVRTGWVRGCVLTPADLVRGVKVAVERAGGRSGPGPWSDASWEAADLAWVLSNLPDGWKQAAEAHVHANPAPSVLEAHLRSDGTRPFVPVPSDSSVAVEHVLVQQLGYQRGDRHVPLSRLTVKFATALQLHPLRLERRAYIDAFVAECGGPAEQVHVQARGVWVNGVFSALRQLWQLKWDNHFKEVYWRLVLNGLATSARLHLSQPCGVCGCAPGLHEPGVGRRHHFWDCPVAQAVVAALQQQLPSAWCHEPLQPHHVLFMHRPAGVSPATTVHKHVWRVVCLAAVCAMDEGRKAAAVYHLEEQQTALAAAEAARQPRVDEGQRRISDFWQPVPLNPEQQQRRLLVQQQRLLAQQLQHQQQQAARLVEVKHAAVARFWELLQDFVVVRAAPRAWLACLAPAHPFLCPDADLTRLRCVRSGA